MKPQKKINWRPYLNNPDVLMAQIQAKNGALGAAIITPVSGGFALEAGSEQNGFSWKSPETIFNSVEQAKAEAEKLWRPV